MTDTPYRLHQSLGYKLSLASRQQERRLDDGLRALGLTRITWCALLAVGNEGLGQPSEIADFVGIDRTAMSRALRQMEDADLISRVSGQGDRRTRQVRLTASGMAAITAGTPLARENAAIMASQLTEAEHQTLQTLLTKLTQDEPRQLKHL